MCCGGSKQEEAQKKETWHNIINEVMMFNQLILEDCIALSVYAKAAKNGICHFFGTTGTFAVVTTVASVLTKIIVLYVLQCMRHGYRFQASPERTAYVKKQRAQRKKEKEKEKEQGGAYTISQGGLMPLEFIYGI